MAQLVEQNNKIRFSIIMAVYNLEDYLERSIGSVENQTFKNFEFIIVDDASTDKSVEKIEELNAKYNNIVFLKHDKNKQAGGARNTALEVAKGEYIVFLDGDDYLASDDVLEKLDKLIGDDITDVTYLGFKIEGDREELVMPTEETCTKTYKAATDKYPNPWSKCWRREFLDDNNIRFKENRYYEDVLFVYNGVMKSKTYKIANFIVHKYTSGRTNSMTTTINLKNIEDTIKNLNDLLEMRQNEYTKEVDIIIKKEIRMCKKRLDDVAKRLYGDEIE